MKNDASNDSIYDITIKLFIVVLIVAWCIMIMYPFLNIILWSLILTFALLPLHRTLSKKLRERPKLTSFIIVFSILVIIILPSGLLINELFHEIKALKLNYANGTLTIPPPAESVKDWPVVGKKFYNIWHDASQNIGQFVTNYQDKILAVGKKLLAGITTAASGVIQIIISLIIAGVLLVVEGVEESMRKFFRKLAGGRGDEFADISLKTISNVVKGILGVALILAIIHGVIFMIAGVPYASIWALIIFVLAVLQIPVIIITLPVIVYLFTTMDFFPAMTWTIVLILAGLSDNVLRPILLGKGAPVPMIVIFIGVIGGFIFSGFIGLFTGAIVLSIGYKLFVGWIKTGNELNT